LKNGVFSIYIEEALGLCPKVVMKTGVLNKNAFIRCYLHGCQAHKFYNAFMRASGAEDVYVIFCE